MSVKMENGGLILVLKYSTVLSLSKVYGLQALGYLNFFLKTNTKLTVNSFSKTDTFGTGTKYPSLRDVHLTERVK